MPTDPLRLKHPIVLVHGLGARSTYGPFEYFHGLPRRLRDAGNKVFVANLTAWHTIEHRSEQLKKQIDAAFPEGRINLIGHSMGGLDSRYLAARPEFAGRVASVTTVGTPNRGSIVGDIALGLVPDSAFHAVERLLGLFNSSSGGFKQVSTKYYTETLAAKLPNAPGVAYFSATSAIPEPVVRHALPMFWVPHRILKSYEGDNDGFVSVHSAKWGEHICTYPGDHYGQIGQFLGLSRGLDYVKFFDEILARLRREAM
jgi:triacylglycerol esterase/lipase EstA (alpha/beta hydrolase family)